MTDALLKILPALVTEALGGSTWIHIIGYTGAGKSVLLQSIVDNATASHDCLLVYTFHPQGMGDETIKEARKIEKSIYLLHKKYQDGLLTHKTFIAIHEWRLLFNLVSDQQRLYDTILDIYRNSKNWGVVFGVTSQTIHLKPMYGDGLRDTGDRMYLKAVDVGNFKNLRGFRDIGDGPYLKKIILGDRALEFASQTWGKSDDKYLWLLDQDCPCVICNRYSIKFAITPNQNQNKEN
jgi:hypothetical protein